MRGAGGLTQPVAFDAPTRVDNGAGGAQPGWQKVFHAWAEFFYQRGGEGDVGGGLSVAARFKVRIWAHDQSRALTGAHSMRDLVTGTRYNIREIDALSDPAHVWLVVESGVAT